MSDQTLVVYVLDNPNEAADELQRLRELKAWLIQILEPALKQLLAPMPEGLNAFGQSGEYAERCGYARGSIQSAMDELQK